MATVRKKTIGNQTYFYLEHTFRESGTFKKVEKYLGKNLPKDIEEQKREFLYEQYRKQWLPDLEQIKHGHAQSQKRMPVSIREQEAEKFAIHFTYDTQRIEGSTLSLRETADLLQKGITPNAKPTRHVKEAESHKAIFDEILTGNKDASYQMILYWHKSLFRPTNPEIAGKIREYQVAISGSKFVPPSPVEVYPLIQEFFKWYAKNKTALHPVELAALAHLKFVTIHPFGDGNGRISRLLMNLILHRAGYPLLNIHYEGRASYYTSLERAQTKRMDFIFVQWFVRKYLKEYRDYLK